MSLNEQGKWLKKMMMFDVFIDTQSQPQLYTTQQFGDF